MSRADPPERILLVRLSALGDVLACLEALDALRRGRPDAEIGWVVERRHAAAVVGDPRIDRLFVFERRKGGGTVGNLRALLRLRRDVRSWRPQVAVDLQGNLKSATIAYLSGARRRIGLPRGAAREGAHLFATERVGAADPAEHRARRALRLVDPVGAAAVNGRPAPLLSPPPDAATAAVGGALGAMGLGAGEFALLLPGTSEFGAFKRWAPARFGELAQRLRNERGLPSLVGYGPGQRALAEAAVAASDGAARLAPETAGIAELNALLRCAALVVGSDSGPVAMGSLAGIPTVALFGPKDPGIYAPRGPRTAVVYKRVYCSPCTLRRCADTICMSTLTVDEACEGVARALGAPGEAARDTAEAVT